MTEEIILATTSTEIPQFLPAVPVPNFVLNEVYSVASIDAMDSAFMIELNVTQANGETYDASHVFRHSDPYGLSPTIKQWLIDNPNSPVTPYEEPLPPTAEELRARMPSITPRQLRLTLVRSGVSLASVTAAIAALPEGPVKDEVQIEWEYSTSFDRLSPTLLAIADSLNLSAESVDELWAVAVAV